MAPAAFVKITPEDFDQGFIDFKLAYRRGEPPPGLPDTRMTMLLAGISSVVWTGAEAWRAYGARQKEAMSLRVLEEGNTNFRKVVEEQIVLLEKAGRISADLASAWRGRISDEFYNTVSPDPVRQHDLLKYLAGEIRQLKGVRSSETNELRAFTHQLLGQSLTGDAAERFALQEAFAARNRQIEALEASGARIDPMLGDPRKFNQQILDNGLQEIEARAAALRQTLQDELAQFESGLQAGALTGFDKQLFELDETFQRNRDAIESFRSALGLTAEDAARLHELNVAGYDAQKARVQELIALESERANRTIEAAEQTSEGMKMLDAGTREFARGMSGALIDFASGVKEADDAFRDFAANFLQAIADMLLQAALLNMVRGALSGFGVQLPLAKGGMVRAMADGGLQPSGMPGAFMANGPTVMPRFNALVGEAGPEVLTVLRAPRMLNLGGMLAASGYIGNTGLSLVNTQQLRSKFAEGGVAGRLPGQFSGLANGGGSTGRIVIEVQTSALAEARIIESSVQGAEVRIVQRMGEDSDVSRATKRLVA